jgi:hypothetical protein
LPPTIAGEAQMTPRTTSVIYRALVVTVFAAVALGLAAWTITTAYIPGAGLLIGLCFWACWGLAKRYDRQRVDHGLR